ncbi:kinase-like protein, partial [Fomitiporia mediterranea MF3/22]|uniref:kinase-like protein n=1 Tax=Fomitiporia mediterranea (strain MF3/22) TaxID=694068 RepID=UPI000440981D
FVKELYVWSKLAHENILPLLGYVLEGDYPSVVSEWIENGTVTKYLKHNSSADPEKLILGIAAGMDYLHDQDIVHSDLKADNVLVGPSSQPLICDFGMSRTLASSLSIEATTLSDVRGSVRWMAIELLDINLDSLHTKETDVWAFGMTVYVCFSVTFSELRN